MADKSELYLDFAAFLVFMAGVIVALLAFINWLP